MARKYGKAAQGEVKEEMHKYKKGQAKSGRRGRPVKNRKQAIAIGLSKAHKKGAKVPSKSAGKSSRATSRTTSPKKSSRTSTRASSRKSPKASSKSSRQSSKK